MSKNATYAKEYLSIVDKVKELTAALDNVECTDKNDLYELVYCKQKLDSWYTIDDLDEDLKSDMFRLHGYIETKLGELDDNRIEKIKSNSLKARYSSTARDFGYSPIIEYLKWNAIKLVTVLIFNILIISGALNRLPGMLSTFVINLSDATAVSEEYIASTQDFCGALGMATGLVVSAIMCGILIRFAIDIAYISMPYMRTTIIANMASERALKSIELDPINEQPKAISLIEKAEGYFEYLSEYIDRLANSDVMINDNHHRNTFNKSKNKLVDRLYNITQKVDDEFYIKHIEGLADAEILYKEINI